MEFPLQVTTEIIIRDVNGNIIVHIGPTPQVVVQAAPPSLASLEMSVNGVDADFTMTDPAGRQYTFFADAALPATLTLQQSPVFANGCALHIINSNNPKGTGAIYLQGKDNDNSGVLLDAADNYLHKGAFDIGAHTYQVETYQNLALQAGWTNFGGGYAPLRYLKLPDGMLYVEGTIQPGVRANGTVIANLPVGYRPLTSARRLVAVDLGVLMFIDFLTNGDLAISGAGPAVTASLCGQISLL
jgi:hypothetical protein